MTSGEGTGRAIVIHKLNHVLEEAEQYLRVSLAAALATDEARRGLAALVAQERTHVEQGRRELRVLGGDLRIRARDEATRLFRERRGEIAHGLEEQFDAHAPSWRGHLRKTMIAYRRWLEEALEPVLLRVSHENEDALSEYVVEAARSFTRLVAAFQDRMAADLEAALGLRLPRTEFEPLVDEPERPDIRTDRPLDTSIELLWFLVPMPVFRALVLHRFRGQLPWETEKNLVRLAGQWSDAVGQSIEQMTQQAEIFIAEELALVERLLAEPEGSRARLEAALGELGTLRETLAEHEAARLLRRDTPRSAP